MHHSSKLIFLLFLLGSFCRLPAQHNYYWVQFADKANDGFTLNHPEQFLSERSVARRAKQHIPIDTGDLPITETYIDSIRPYISELKHRLKWFNVAVVLLPDSTYADSIRRFSFVDTVNKIEFPPSRSIASSEKLESVTPADQHYLYRNQYGAAYRQTNMLNVDLLHQTGARGQGMIISVMDNGFLNVSSIQGFDSVRPRILATWDFVHNDEDVYADGAHGTSVFSCMAANIPQQYLGTAPASSYFLLTTEDNSAEWIMEEYNWAAAAEWADSAGADIFSTSLGYTTFDNHIGGHSYGELDGHSTLITRAGNKAFGKGILVITSAGNEGTTPWHYISAPADGDSILTVGAVDTAGKIASFSSRGPTATGKIKPDICAQGAPSAVLTVSGNIGFGSGTSFSCPIIAGSAASLWSAFPDKSARDISTAIVLSCPTFWQPNNDYGYGIPNFYTAYQLLKTNYNNHILQITDDVLLYPNPFADQLNITLYGGKADRERLIEIFDMAGRRVFSQQAFIRQHTFETLIYPALGNLPAGKYILRLDRNADFNHILIKGK